MAKPRGAKPGERRGGRKPGVPNKVTATAREAFARLVDGNAHRVQEWLDAVATTDGPKAALQCFLDLAEYHVPKLARTELAAGDKDGAVSYTFTWRSDALPPDTGRR